MDVEETKNAAALVNEHRPLAIFLARIWCDGLDGLDTDAVESDALLGLWNAALKFNPSRKTRFATYARTLILREIYAGLRREGRERVLIEELRAAGSGRRRHENPGDIAAESEEAEFVKANLPAERYGRAHSPRLSATALARELGISRSAAALRVRKARKLVFEEPGLS